MIAELFYLHDITVQTKPAIRIQQGKSSKAKKDWIKINKCIASSQSILIEEISTAYPESQSLTHGVKRPQNQIRTNNPETITSDKKDIIKKSWANIDIS